MPSAGVIGYISTKRGNGDQLLSRVPVACHVFEIGAYHLSTPCSGQSGDEPGVKFLHVIGRVS